MVNLPINFKERQLCYMINLVMGSSAAGFFDFITEVRTKLKAISYNPTDLVPISIAPDDLCTLYRMIVSRSESESATMNTDIRTTLNPQLTSLVSTGTSEQITAATFVQTFITETNNNASAQQVSQIQTGRTWIMR